MGFIVGCMVGNGVACVGSGVGNLVGLCVGKGVGSLVVGSLVGFGVAGVPGSVKALDAVGGFVAIGGNVVGTAMSGAPGLGVSCRLPVSIAVGCWLFSDGLLAGLPVGMKVFL